MNKAKGIGCLVAVVFILATFVLSNALFTVHETEQVLITQFGDVIGKPITKAGLNITGTLLACLFAVWLGWWIARSLHGSN